VDEGAIELDGNVIEQEFGREAIAGIDHHVVARKQARGGGGGDALDDGDDVHAWIEASHEGRRDEGLARADVGGAKERLAVEVGSLDDVVIAQSQAAYASCRELSDHRSAEAAAPNDGDASIFEPTLTGQADLGQNELTRMTVDGGHGPTEARRLDGAKPGRRM